ncbi:MAG TPA: terminase family protein [Allosphingosinicella sp.]|jgi:phage terminase large subunit-like protein
MNAPLLRPLCRSWDGRELGDVAGFCELLAYAALIEDPEELARFVRRLPTPVRRRLIETWEWQAHGGQIVPRGDWRVWLLMAGRGFGKTRAGAEWVSAAARANPRARIALVGATREQVAKVMIEGRSGLLRVARTGEAPLWVPSRGLIRFESGAEGHVYSAEAGEGLRGPEHDFAWCDELAKWERAGAAWDNLMLGLRCGERPRAVVTTTPRPLALLRRIEGDEATAVTRGRMADNLHLDPAVRAEAARRYAGTRLGRQELDGVLFDEIQGALWTRSLIEESRLAGGRSPDEFRRVVIGVDPPASIDGDACGIVACGLGRDGIGYVLGDHSAGGLSPEGWARKVAAAAQAWSAHRVVAERNNGGLMVETVLRGANVALPVKLVHASDGKSARAEPVAALFESKRAKLAGAFPELEDELCGLVLGGGYEGKGSPDRADAMVWALTELMLGPPRAEPRISLL